MKTEIGKDFDVENQTENTHLTNSQTSSWWGRKVCCCCTNGGCLVGWISVAFIVGGVASVCVALSRTLEFGTDNLPLYISGGIETTLGFIGFTCSFSSD